MLCLKYFTLLLFLAIFQIEYANTANILFYHHMATYSHRVATYPLAVALVNRGHQVTYISPYYPRDKDKIHPNITEIVPKKFAKTVDDQLSSRFDINFRYNNSMPRIVFGGFYEKALEACEHLLAGPELEEYLGNTEKLDLIVLDDCLTECAMLLVHKYKAKHIFFNTIAHLPNEYDWYGIQPENSAIPEQEVNPPRAPMSFLERVFNSLISIHFRYVQYSYSIKVDELIRKYWPNITENMPFIDDMARNTSLVLYTGDFATDYPRSHPPIVVNVAGLHLENTTKPVPDFIQEFLKNDPFVYINFGSIVVSSDLPDKTKEAFFSAIKSYPKVKFLWKWDGPVPENMPKNLLLSKWFPQQDILAHPNVKAFLTQGGRPSAFESIYNAVPMITFPVMGDQDGNAQRLNEMGGNIILELGMVTKESLSNALEKVLNDEVMKERMHELKRMFLDQPMKPLEKAVWYTEYVLRWKDTSHLRAASFDQYWFQRRLIDVWAFLFAVSGVSLLIIFQALKGIYRVIGNLRTPHTPEKKKKK